MINHERLISVSFFASCDLGYIFKLPLLTSFQNLTPSAFLIFELKPSGRHSFKKKSSSCFITSKPNNHQSWKCFCRIHCNSTEKMNMVVAWDFCNREYFYEYYWMKQQHTIWTKLTKIRDKDKQRSAYYCIDISTLMYRYHIKFAYEYYWMK